MQDQGPFPSEKLGLFIGKKINLMHKNVKNKIKRLFKLRRKKIKKKLELPFLQ